MTLDGTFEPPPTGARLRVYLPEHDAWCDAEVLGDADGLTELRVGASGEMKTVSLSAANCRPPAATVAADGARDVVPLAFQPHHADSSALLSPSKPRFGITDVDQSSTAAATSGGSIAALARELSGGGGARVAAKEEAEHCSRVGLNYQALIPGYAGPLAPPDPAAVGASAPAADCGATSSEPELIWAPHFEGVIRDLAREPPRAEVDRYEELRRRQQKKCGIPGCLLHDKHPGPHIFPAPTGKRQGKAPWRGVPRTTAPSAPPKPRPPRRADASEESSDDGGSAGSGSKSDDDGMPAGKRLNADRAAAKEARRLARGAHGRKRERQSLNYRAFGGIIPRGAAEALGTSIALAAAKAAKGDLSDRANVGLARGRRAADPRPAEAVEARYERVTVRHKVTRALIAGRHAPMRMNLHAYLERFPDFEELPLPELEPPPARGGRRRGGGRGRGGGGRGRARWARQAHTSSEGSSEVEEVEGGSADGSEEGGSSSAADDDEPAADFSREFARARANEIEEEEEEMTQERVNALFALGSRVCAFPDCRKIYASTDGVRKHAKRCHMAWVLERDKAREGVWLEPLLTASDPQLFGTTAQAGKRGTLGRAGALCGALPSGRRGLLAVPWSLADKRGLGGKRALIDREREQLWPPPRADWLSCARLCPSGWLLLPNSTAAETQPASAGTVAAAAVAADDGPTAKRARHGGGGGGGAWPVRCASAAQPSAEPHDGQAAARAEPAQSQPAQRTDSPQPAFAEAEHGSYAASAERYERYAGGDAGNARGARAVGSAHAVTAADAHADGAEAGWQEHAEEEGEARAPAWRARAPRQRRMPTRPQQHLVAGSRAQLPPLWPDGRLLPQLSGLPRPMSSRPAVHVVNRATEMSLHQMLANPRLRQLYFAAAGHAVPQPLQLKTDEPSLHARGDQFARLVYWKRAAGRS